jgi:hypothetical protein
LEARVTSEIVPRRIAFQPQQVDTPGLVELLYQREGSLTVAQRGVGQRLEVELLVTPVRPPSNSSSIRRASRTRPAFA